MLDLFYIKGVKEDKEYDNFILQLNEYDLDNLEKVIINRSKYSCFGKKYFENIEPDSNNEFNYVYCVLEGIKECRKYLRLGFTIYYVLT